MKKLTLAAMIAATGAATGAAYNKKLITKEARVASSEELVITIIGGVEETRNTAHAGDFVVKGDQGEEYVIPAAKFNKLYKSEVELSYGESLFFNSYISLPDSIQAVEVTEELLFESPWGGDMVAFPGDYIVYRSATDAYRVEKLAFESTYEAA